LSRFINTFPAEESTEPLLEARCSSNHCLLWPHLFQHPPLCRLLDLWLWKYFLFWKIMLASNYYIYYNL